jgi:hypothetical protein
VARQLQTSEKEAGSRVRIKSIHLPLTDFTIKHAFRQHNSLSPSSKSGGEQRRAHNHCALALSAFSVLEVKRADVSHYNESQ